MTYKIRKITDDVFQIYLDNVTSEGTAWTILGKNSDVEILKSKLNAYIAATEQVKVLTKIQNNINRQGPVDISVDDVVKNRSFRGMSTPRYIIEQTIMFCAKTWFGKDEK